MKELTEIENDIIFLKGFPKSPQRDSILRKLYDIYWEENRKECKGECWDCLDTPCMRV